MVKRMNLTREQTKLLKDRIERAMGWGVKHRLVEAAGANVKAPVGLEAAKKLVARHKAAVDKAEWKASNTFAAEKRTAIELLYFATPDKALACVKKLEEKYSA